MSYRTNWDFGVKKWGALRRGIKVCYSSHKSRSPGTDTVLREHRGIFRKSPWHLFTKRNACKSSTGFYMFHRLICKQNDNPMIYNSELTHKHYQALGASWTLFAKICFDLKTKDKFFGSLLFSQLLTATKANTLYFRWSKHTCCNPHLQLFVV